MKINLAHLWHSARGFLVASYRKRGGVWHIQILRQGYPALTKTFKAKMDGDRWVRGVERGLDLCQGKLEEMEV